MLPPRKAMKPIGEDKRMRILIVEDDFTSRFLLQRMLEEYGRCEVAVNGAEALQAYDAALGEGEPYDLICLDVMMPEMDGHQVLKEIRDRESERGIRPSDEVKVVMTTALNSPREVFEAFYQGGCTAYLVKPIEKKKLVQQLRALRLVP